MVTVTAPVNIAVIKYWGKRDVQAVLPCNSSLSVTLNDLVSTTTASYSDIDSDQGTKSTYRSHFKWRHSTVKQSI